MASKCLELEYATCASSEWNAAGALLVQPDALGEGGANEGAASMQPLGLYARPDDPTEAGAAGALVGRRGDETFIAPQTDPRTIGTVPQGPKGSATLYAPKVDLTSYLHLDGGDGTGKAYTQLLLKYGDVSHVISLDSTTAGQENVQIRHGDGMALTMVAGGANSATLSNAAGDAYVEVRDGGININGAEVLVNGGQVVGNIPAAVSVLLNDPEFIAWKAGVDTFIAAVAAAGGAVVPPGLVVTAPLTVTGSQVLKASKAP